ncbi:hypothetical protein HJG60_009548 [Phyllostomus discolor]|uniref:Uncharacterized protein n=1 Tax=Phyllostomus discolor TaxID=89673 RepID=A0A833YHL8_9CHIR|nr:hypothetical protein HJG60_009548 [Phyllostomus discolor]
MCFRTFRRAPRCIGWAHKAPPTPLSLRRAGPTTWRWSRQHRTTPSHSRQAKWLPASPGPASREGNDPSHAWHAWVQSQGVEYRSGGVECRPRGVECRPRGVECRPRDEYRPRGVEYRPRGVECRPRGGVQTFKGTAEASARPLPRQWVPPHPAAAPSWFLCCCQALGGSAPLDRGLTRLV